MIRPTAALFALLACACSGPQNGGAQTGAGASSAQAPASGGAPEAAGPAAPDFTLSSLDGQNVSLRDYHGDKVVLLDFWSTSCDPCLREMPELVKIYKARKDKGFELLAISVDGPDTLAQVSSVARDKGMIFPVLLDSETAVMDQYNPKGEMPFTVLIDRTGSIRLKRAGYQAGDEKSMQALVDAIDQALAEK